jgi:hypothetical protein
MKRRDLLKQAGALALGLPAARAAGAMSGVQPAQSPTVKDLLVTLSGPFCYWLEEKWVRVMAPPVGKDYYHSPHQAWVATHGNETTLNSNSLPTPPEYKLVMPGRDSFPLAQGTATFTYGQSTPMGKPPLFNLRLPIPDQVVGVRPTSVAIVKDDPNPPFQVFAAGWTLVYKNVDLNNVVLTGLSPSFKPCFTNDEFLPVASLGFFLTRIIQTSDHSHTHAKYVWSRMLSMYPWMQSDVKGICFDPNFNPASCDYVPPPGTKGCVNVAAVGPGNDCEVPIMLLIPGGPTKASAPKG